ncbi:alpha/beta hydrolase [Bradyrhizobium liaoningense]|uniref:alpha/beta hydrolase n=1 Tax=Bradyrhizobium liaoningense TaxID=43992 RepID=UPI002011EE80|nr:alpha/beta hydrolase [Bradyrhizobium liaoningense]
MIMGRPDTNDGSGYSVVRLRKRASAFFESLSIVELVQERYRNRWVLDWTRIGNEYRTLAESARQSGLTQIAREECLCSLTALEVAKSLCCQENPARVDLEVGSTLSSFDGYLGKSIERVEVDYLDHGLLSGFFFRAPCHGSPAPAIICVADDEVTLHSIARRLLPASVGREISLLLIDGSNATIRRPFRPEHILACWLDYLESRPDVDIKRIAIYGEGMGAHYASNLALSDRRIAAAVCDGSLWTSVRRRALVPWMTGVEMRVGDKSWIGSLRLSRRVPCPILVVVGHRSMVREQDAVELQADCRQAGADCSIVVPNRIIYPPDEIENFIAVDDFVLDWIGFKFGSAGRFDPVTYL